MRKLAVAAVHGGRVAVQHRYTPNCYEKRARLGARFQATKVERGNIPAWLNAVPLMKPAGKA